jgi:hypothetical protein
VLIISFKLNENENERLEKNGFRIISDTFTDKITPIEKYKVFVPGDTYTFINNGFCGSIWKGRNQTDFGNGPVPYILKIAIIRLFNDENKYKMSLNEIIELIHRLTIKEFEYYKTLTILLKNSIDIKVVPTKIVYGYINHKIKVKLLSREYIEGSVPTEEECKYIYKKINKISDDSDIKEKYKYVADLYPKNIIKRIKNGKIEYIIIDHTMRKIAKNVN